MNKSPLRFTYPLTATINGREIEVDAELTFHPCVKANRRVISDPYCEVHSAVVVVGMDDDEMDLPHYDAETLANAAREAANAALDAITAEAAARLVIERENAEVREALSRRPINDPCLHINGRPPLNAGERGMARMLDALG